MLRQTGKIFLMFA